MECHLFPEQNAMFVMAAMAARIQEVKTSLDVWALTKSPEVLRTNYGALAWEYSPPGDLSANTPGRTNVTQQALIPDNIKKARFNLYIVNYDGSFGIHNGPYSFELLNAATNWIQTELNK